MPGGPWPNRKGQGNSRRRGAIQNIINLDIESILYFMHSLFPPNVGVTQIRGFINILKDNPNGLEMSKLAEESDEGVDDLLPIVEASTLLGFIKTGDDLVSLTPEGKRFAMKEELKILREKIVGIEPFRSVIDYLGDNQSATTHELEGLLYKKKLAYRGSNSASTEELRNVLIHWGVRVKLLTHNQNKDTWTMKRYV